jgi:hypothetical protein
LNCGMSISRHAFNGVGPKKCLYCVGFFKPIACQYCGRAILLTDDDEAISKNDLGIFRACARCRLP